MKYHLGYFQAIRRQEEREMKEKIETCVAFVILIGALIITGFQPCIYGR